MKEELFDLVISCSTLQEYTDAASRLIQDPFWIMDSAFRILSITHHPSAEPYLRAYGKKTDTTGHVQEWIASGLYRRIERTEMPVRIFDADFGQNLIVTDIRVGHQRKARITIFEEKPVSDDTVLQLCRGASVYLRNENLADNAGPMEYLLSSSLNGAKVSEKETSRILKEYGIGSAKEKYRIACLRSMASDPDERMPMQAAYLHEIRHRDAGLIGVMFDGEAVFLETDAHRLHPFLDKDGFCIGYSWEFRDPAQIHDHYLQARYTAEHADEKENDFRDHAEAFSASFLKEKMNLSSMIMPEIKECMAYDSQYHTDYFHTLEVYMDCGESKAEASRKLMVHLNTVKYRLGQIEHLFHIDFSRDRKLIQLSLMMMRQMDQL